MDINWLIDNEKYLNEIIKDYKNKETELFKQFKAAIVKEKNIRFSSDCFGRTLGDSYYYQGKDWKVYKTRAIFKGEEIISKDYIKELYELANSVSNNQAKSLFAK